MANEITSLLREPDFYGDPPQELAYPHLLKDLSMQALERAPIYDYRGKSAKAVQARLAEVRATVIRRLGLAPRALPVKPTRVVERPAVQYDGFSIRPVVIERGKGWYITAHLYLPDGLRQPAPAVLHVHGHSYQGKSTISYARRCRGLARHGFVVLFVDYPEADERKGTGHALWYPVMAGLTVQGIMVADNSAALTYLAGLPFVDETRIGVTGASGGGNQTVFFSAVDPRVAASAPCVAPTLFQHHASLGSGAWCHCEAVPGLAAAGVEYHDLLAAVAPRPQRVFNGVLDPLFPIVGARRAVAEAAVAYRALGAKECTLEEHYCEHAVPELAREGIYRFFADALKRPGDVRGADDEGEDVDLSDPRLRALPRRPRDFSTIADLYRAKVDAAKPKPLRAAQLNRLLGRTSADARTGQLVRYDEKQWVRALLQTGDGALLPMLVRGREGKVTLVMADSGKAKALKQIAGAAASFDWRGQGETAPEEEWQQRAAHYLAIGGASLCGGRVTDLIAVFRWLEQEGRAVSKVVALGGESSLVALFAATAEPRLPKVELHGLLPSFADAPGMEGQVRYTAWVPGIALATDVPQLLSALGRRAVVKSWLTPKGNVIREGYT
jgi:hypothetical protein